MTLLYVFTLFCTGRKCSKHGAYLILSLAVENTILFFHVSIPVQLQFSSSEQTEFKKIKLKILDL